MGSRGWRATLARAVSVAVLITAVGSVIPAHAGLPPHDPHRVLVGFEPTVSPVDRLLAHRAAGTQVETRFDWIDVDVVRLPEGLTPTAAIERYRGDQRVKYAEPNFERTLFSQPNDTYFNLLWGLHNTGQQSGWQSDADIDAPEGWDRSYGPGSFPSTGGIRVGIVDSGIDQSHPDLSGKTKACAQSTNGSGNPTSGCTDTHGHGTHVAGTIAAIANNARGVAGVAPNAELAVYRAFSGSSGSDADTIAGIRWARTTGAAKVVSMSFGGPSSSSMNAELTSAWSAGTLLVAAAGNDANSTTQYPAGHADVISVAALDPGNFKAWFSNTNADVELTAPGVDILSTYPGNQYAWSDGTSMATPHVSGVAAVVMGVGALTNAATRSLMNSTAVDLGSSGRDTSYGYGRVNLHAALGSMPVTPVITTPTEGAIVTTSPVTIAGTARANGPMTLRRGTTTIGTTTANASGAWSASIVLADGSHSITATADIGTANERVSSVRTFTVDAPPAPPVVTEPAAGATVRTGSVRVAGTAESGSTVTVSENGSDLATVVAAGGSFSTTLDLAQGAHTLTLTATDTSAKTSTPTQRSFSVVIPPPPPVIQTPQPSTHVPDGTAVPVSGTSVSAVSIRIREGATLLATVAPDGAGGWSTAVSLGNGARTLRAFAVDGDGDESDPASTTFLVGPLPTVQIGTPAEGAYVGTTTTVAGTATPGSSVTVHEGSEVRATATANSSGAWSATATFSQGDHTITAVAMLGGVSGNPSPARTFHIDTEIPEVFIAGGVVSAYALRSVTLRGTAFDSVSLDRVEVVLARTGAPLTQPYVADCDACDAGATDAEWELTVDVPPGVYVATVTAVDRAGNESLSRSTRFVKL